MRAVGDRSTATPRPGSISKRAFWTLFPAITAAGISPSSAIYLLVPGAVCYLVLTGRLPRLTACGVLGLALGCWALLSLVWTADYANSTSGARLLIASLVLFILTTSEIVRTGSWHPPIQVLATAGPVVAIVYLLFARSVPSGPTAALTGDLGRISLSFIGVNYTAYTIAVCFAATLALLSLRGPRPALRAALACGLVLLVEGAALMRADARGAQLGAVLAVVAAIVGARCAWAALRVGFAVLILAGTLILTGTLGPIVDSADLTKVFAGPDRGLSGRQLLWESALAAIQYRPMTGSGIDAYPFLLWNGLFAHNLFLAAILGLGVVGLVLYGLILLAAFWPAHSRRTRAHHGEGARVRAVFLAASIPIWSTGVWEWTNLNWTVLGICAGAAALSTNDRARADSATIADQPMAGRTR